MILQRAIRIASVLTMSLFAMVPAAVAKDDSPAGVVYNIYLNQDRTFAPAAGRSIELGLRAAFDDAADLRLSNGAPVDFDFIVKDHRTNLFRTTQNVRAFNNDPKALFIFADVYSPQYLANRDLINRSEALTFVPWAAGTQITREFDDPNWIFRLSVNDAMAGQVMTDYAVDVAGCRDSHLYLADNGWGRSNYASLRAALAERGRRAASTHWVPWLAEPSQIERMVDTFDTSQVDCILAALGHRESELLIDALLRLPVEVRPRLISHWGLASRNFAARVPFEKREAVSLRFVQSCHDLHAGDGLTALALERLRTHAEGADWATADIPAAVGFVHAFDLGRLIVEALEKATLTGDARADRHALREQMYQLSDSVEGLLKRYEDPFSKPSEATPAGHDALELDDICMALFDGDGRIRTYRPAESGGAF